MTLNKKLLLVGLAVGVTTLILYERSKKKQASKVEASHSSSSSGGHHGLYAAGGAGLAAGAGVAAYQHHQSNAASAGFPSSPAEFTWEHLRDANFIAKLLSDCVIDQFLFPFYSYHDIQNIAQRVASSGALAAAADAWQLPPSLAADLVKLALFDVSFLLDDSASMQQEGRLRRDGLKTIVKLAAEAATRFDTDGVELNWLNSHEQAVVHSGEQATQFVSRCEFAGRATPMGTSLEGKILEKEFYPKLKRETLRKPLLIIIIGDGQPTGESSDKFRKELKEAKKKAKKSRYGADAVSLQVAIVGNDSGAHEWLEELDSDKDVGDLVDVCSDIRTESAQVKRQTGIELTEDLFALKVCLGSIDSSYDASDEGHSSKAAKRKEERREKDSYYAKDRARFMQDRNAVLGPYMAAQNMGGFSNTAAAGPAAAHAPAQHQRTPSHGSPAIPPTQGGGGYPPAGGAPYPPPSGGPSPYPPPSQGGYPPAGGAPYPPPSQGGYPPAGGAPYPPQNPGGYPPAEGGGGGYPPAGGGGGGYPPAGGGGGGGYPPPVSAYGGGGYPPAGNSPYPPHQAPSGFGGPPGYPPMGSPPAYARGMDGTNQQDPGFQSGVGGFMMPSPNYGGGGGSGADPNQGANRGAGGPGFPSGPSFPSAPY
ncbi:unnamed protein product [Tilletia laevis]|uniref:VWFA domain-containing protein n=3 Tax=Tilletia TaxID=13289 RepID=A0A8X7MR72_9BASI|nr:hypothetical protein CF336_g6183 [Tilletia laevis]KAE8193073.1 hypothetical protein CF328_g5158 [Tilletia controversa]KAE8255568.1 hypothetical protein A4X03_0g5539 [Tilletia caries]KAE8202767.1 hypothetical protein CF335_g3289 [Tilletia laevis]KAE8245503.1 hypothetical protein A4X06_0g5654 [Tilletia controversa]